MIVQTIVPGDPDVPTDRNQSAPSAMIPGTLANVSTLLASVGGASDSPSRAAISTCAAEALLEVTSTGASTISSTPRRYGGAIRGNG